MPRRTSEREKTKTRGPYRTTEGRIVYDRKIHSFSNRDLARILNSTVKRLDFDDPGGIEEAFQAITDAMLETILKTFGIVGYGELFGDIIRLNIRRILEAVSASHWDAETLARFKEEDKAFYLTIGGP